LPPGADTTAAKRAAIGSGVGVLGGLLMMERARRVAGLPDFWGIAAVAAVIALVVTAASSAGDWYFTPAVFGGFA
jgi:hypothetical protein